MPSTTVFRLLGPPDVRTRDGTRIDLGPKQSLILAALLVNAGQVVAPGTLAAWVWGGDLPANPGSRLRTLMAELRRTLAPAGPDLIRTRAPGYLLDLGDARCDAHELRAAVAAAREEAADSVRALAHYDRALALWRGPALDGLRTPPARAEASRLDELRLSAQEERAEILLGLGGHHELLPDLTALAAANPGRERPHAQLMLALFRCGRTEEALAAYRTLRGHLAGRAGLEPSARIQRLHKQILDADPRLAETPERPRILRPRQLPPDTAVFAGREAELAALDAAAERSGRLILVTGAAGTGKTTLAVRWARSVAGRFPDGQVFLDMRGFDPGPRRGADEHLPGILRDLGVPRERIPDAADERTALLRSTLSGRRVLIVADNIADPDQVRPLLPGEPGSLVLATSRDRLAGLVAVDGAHRIPIDVLGAEAALTVLAQVSGRGLGADDEAAAELAELCGRLPLALRIAGARLADLPHHDLARFTAELTGDRLRWLRIPGDPRADVGRALSASYESMPAGARRAFRLSTVVRAPAGLHADAAAALLGHGTAEAEDLLDALTARHLAACPSWRRYAFHDLLAEYGAGLAAADPDRGAAVRRLLDHYLHTTLAAVGGTDRLPGEAPEPAGEHARRRLAEELPNLVAAVHHAAGHGFDEHAWRLTDALHVPLAGRMSAEVWRAVAEAGLAAARRRGHVLGEAAMHYSLAVLGLRTADLDAALAAFERALAGYREGGHRHGESLAVQGIGDVHHLKGDWRLAVEHARRALAIDRETGHRVTAAIALNNIAQAQAAHGDLDGAFGDLTAALDLARECGDLFAEAVTHGNLAYAHTLRGDLRDAVRHLELAGDLHRRTGRVDEQMNVRLGLGAVHTDSGRHDKAAASYTLLLDEATRLGNLRQVVLAHNGLANTARLAGDLAKAEEHLALMEKSLGDAEFGYGRFLLALTRGRTAIRRGAHRDGLRHTEEALDIAVRLGKHVPQARAVLAEARLRLGDPDGCLAEALEALRAQRASGQRLAAARTAVLAGRAHALRGERDVARGLWAEAAEVFERVGVADLAEVRALLAGG